MFSNGNIFTEKGDQDTYFSSFSTLTDLRTDSDLNTDRDKSPSLLLIIHFKL